MNTIKCQLKGCKRRGLRSGAKCFCSLRVCRTHFQECMRNTHKYALLKVHKAREAGQVG